MRVIDVTGKSMRTEGSGGKKTFDKVKVKENSSLFIELITIGSEFSILRSLLMRPSTFKYRKSDRKLVKYLLRFLSQSSICEDSAASNGHPS